MRGSRTFHFTPGSLIPLPEAEQTDHSEEDSSDENFSSSVNMEGGSETPPPTPQQDDVLSPITASTTNDDPTSPGGNNDDGDDNKKKEKKPQEGDGSSSSSNDDAPRVTLSPDTTQSVVHAGVRTNSTNNPSPNFNVVVERESSKLQNGGVDPVSSCCPYYHDELGKAKNIIVDNSIATILEEGESDHNYNNNNNNNNAKTHSSKMDDDSLGVRSAASSPLQPQRQEPEGVVPTHRIGQSRRFSDDLGAMMQKELEEEELNGGTTEATSSNGDTTRSPPSSPPDGLKEISISKVMEDDDDDDDESSSDDISAPSTSLPVGSMTPPPAPLKAGLQLLEEDEELQPLKKSEHQSPEDSSWNINNNKPMNDSFEGSGYNLNASYNRAEQQQQQQQYMRPPSVTDQVPPESDVSVFSIHSGYAMHDPNNGLPPRIVPGTMVQSPAAFGHQYANIPSHIHQVPLPAMSNNGYSQHQHYAPHYSSMPPPAVIMAQSQVVGKRKIHFRLVEDIRIPTSTRKGMRGSFLSFRRNSSRNNNLLMTPPLEEEPPQEMDRGRVTVSWYEGTTTLELMEHVRNAVIRKLGLQGTTKLAELRILDEGSNPPEEIVLTPYIPSGSELLLRFTTRDAGGDVTPPPYGRQSSYTGGAPDSPSAAPSPHASALDLEGLGLNPNQLALLGARLRGLQVPMPDSSLDEKTRDSKKKSSSKNNPLTPSKKSTRIVEPRRAKSDRGDGPSDDSATKDEDAQNNSNDDQSSVFEMQSLHPEDQIQKSLQNITELLLLERQKALYYPKQEKRQVVFTLANYFVLFLSLIAISAEIQARAPEWNAAIERHLTSVKNCSKDQDALFECVSNGDFSGLVASVVLWISRSAATKRIFLFGFDSPRKLWTVVYECLVTSVCWGFSYIFIRRGMNPDTNRNFLQKYWKDAVYGSLAGFNAAFMKHVMKNLIPQEAIEDALQERQLKILSWLPSMSH